jgi:transcriptional regulator with XRE-family HTH domain
VQDGSDGDLAGKLNQLFGTVYPTGRGPYSNAEVAAAIRERGGAISDVYIWQLRKGLRANPTKDHLAALAGFFGVSPAYFFDAGVADRAAPAQLPDPGTEPVSLRAVLARSGLSEESQRLVQQLVQRCLELEGLTGTGEPDAGPGPEPDPSGVAGPRPGRRIS